MAENMILSRLEGVKARFDEVGQLITDPAVIADMKRYVKLNREYKQLEPVIEAYEAYKNLLSNLESARQMLAEEKDEELRDMAKRFDLKMISVAASDSRRSLSGSWPFQGASRPAAVAKCSRAAAAVSRKCLLSPSSCARGST